MSQFDLYETINEVAGEKVTMKQDCQRHWQKKFLRSLNRIQIQISISISKMEEAWSISRRRKQGQLMRRKAKVIARVRKRKLSRLADPQALKRRAQKAARAIIFKRVASGRTKGEIESKQMLIAIDKKLEKHKGRINKIAKKILPKIKKQEFERLRQLKANRGK